MICCIYDVYMMYTYYYILFYFSMLIVVHTCRRRCLCGGFEGHDYTGPGDQQGT